MPTGAVMMANSAALMNDAAQVTFTNDKLLPYLKLAYQELQLKLNNIGAGVVLDTSAASTLSANDTELDPPNDLIAPISLEERAVGSTSEADWVALTQHRILPNRDKVDTLNDYAWNEQVFRLVGALVDRSVRIKYWRSLDAIVSASTLITILNVQLFLEYKTAALYCLFPGGQPKKGADLANQAEYYWNMAANIEVKTTQGMPVRRKGYGHSRKMIGRIRGAF